MMFVTTPALLHLALTALQLAGGDVTPVLAPDSQNILRSLRGAQREFEYVRRQHLPWTLGTPTGRCDVVVGRFCYWDDDDDEPAFTPKPEHPRVVRERHQLLARLDSGAAQLPGDLWIAGQRVRYLVEASRYHEALWLLEECAAEPWWCRALAGYVSHVMGDYAFADSAFAAALVAMPVDERCTWTDLSVVLEGRHVDDYREIPCETRGSVNERIWWLGDPLYLVAGNERRSEHFARLVLSRMLDGTGIVYGHSWGRDNRELVLRYGWAIAWEREQSRGLEPRPRIIGHHADGGRRFLPPYEFVTDLARATPDEWDIDPDIPRSRTAVRYATEFRPLTHQLAVFRRDDTAVVVVGYDYGNQTGSSYSAPSAIHAGVFLHVGPSVGFTASNPASRGTGALSLRVPRAAALVSVEALDRRDSVAARARYWVDLPERLPEGFAASDLLLLDPGVSLPASLEDAAARARGSVRFAPGEPIEFYWEVYGAPADSAHEVSISVTKLGKGFFRSAVEVLGLAGERQPETFQWEGMPGALHDGIGRALGIRLADDDEGRYLVRLEITTSSGARAVTQRQIEVKKR